MRASDPIKLNYLALGNSILHLGTHVLARYVDDQAPGGPVPWEAIFRTEPAPGADLQQPAADLRRLLGR